MGDAKECHVSTVAHIKDQQGRWWRCDDIDIEQLEDGPSQCPQDLRTSTKRAEKRARHKVSCLQDQCPAALKDFVRRSVLDCDLPELAAGRQWLHSRDCR